MDGHIDPDRLEWDPQDTRRVDDGGSLLGEGTFGSVFRGLFEGDPVAIKVIRAARGAPGENTASRIAAEQQHMREIRRLSNLRFRYIVQFYGISRSPVSSEMLIVTECLEGGSLYQSLDRARAANAVLADACFLQIASHIARALRFIHNSGIIHGDMKPHNVLLTSAVEIDNARSLATFPTNVQAKVADFGMSKRLSSFQPSSMALDMSTVDFGEQPFGTYAYMAPECFYGVADLNDEQLKAVDVYAFGIVMYEMLSGMSPWQHEGVKNPLRLQHLVSYEKKRPFWGPRMDTIPREYKGLVERCWDEDNARRPTCKELNTILDSWMRARREGKEITLDPPPGNRTGSAAPSSLTSSTDRAPSSTDQSSPPPPDRTVEPVRGDDDLGSPDSGQFTRVESEAITEPQAEHYRVEIARRTIRSTGRAYKADDSDLDDEDAVERVGSYPISDSLNFESDASEGAGPSGGRGNTVNAAARYWETGGPRKPRGPPQRIGTNYSPGDSEDDESERDGSDDHLNESVLPDEPGIEYSILADARVRRVETKVLPKPKVDDLHLPIKAPPKAPKLPSPENDDFGGTDEPDLNPGLGDSLFAAIARHNEAEKPSAARPVARPAPSQAGRLDSPEERQQPAAAMIDAFERMGNEDKDQHRTPQMGHKPEPTLHLPTDAKGTPPLQLPNGGPPIPTMQLPNDGPPGMSLQLPGDAHSGSSRADTRPRHAGMTSGPQPRPHPSPPMGAQAAPMEPSLLLPTGDHAGKGKDHPPGAGITLELPSSVAQHGPGRVPERKHGSPQRHETRPAHDNRYSEANYESEGSRFDHDDRGPLANLDKRGQGEGLHVGSSGALSHSNSPESSQYDGSYTTSAAPPAQPLGPSQGSGAVHHGAQRHSPSHYSQGSGQPAPSHPPSYQQHLPSSHPNLGQHMGVAPQQRDSPPPTHLGGRIQPSSTSAHGTTLHSNYSQPTVGHVPSGTGGHSFPRAGNAYSAPNGSRPSAGGGQGPGGSAPSLHGAAARPPSAHSQGLDDSLSGFSLPGAGVSPESVMQVLRNGGRYSQILRWWNEGHAAAVADGLAKHDGRTGGTECLNLLSDLLTRNNKADPKTKSAAIAKDLCHAVGNLARGGTIERRSSVSTLPLILLTMRSFSFDVNVYSAACYALANLLKVSNVIQDDRRRREIAEWVSHAMSFNLNGPPQPRLCHLAYTAASAGRNFVWMREQNALAFLHSRDPGQPSAAQNLCASMVYFRQDATVVDASLSALAALVQFPNQRALLVQIGIVASVARVMGERRTRPGQSESTIMGLSTLSTLVAGPTSHADKQTIAKGFVTQAGISCVIKVLDNGVRSRNERVIEEGLSTVAAISRFDKMLLDRVVQGGGVAPVIQAISCAVTAPESVTQRSAEMMCGASAVLSQNPGAVSTMRQSRLAVPLRTLVTRYAHEQRIVALGNQAIERVR